MPHPPTLPAGYRALGSSGLVLSQLGIGASTFGRSGMRAVDADSVQAIVDRAIGLGVSYFDLAEGYGDRPGLSEELFAGALHGRREQVVIGTKFGRALHSSRGHSYALTGARKYIIASVEESLTRLGTDYIDLYQIHFPDPHTPIEETLRALDDLVRSGKVRYVGASNFPAWRIAEAAHTARSLGLNGFVSTTSEYNLLWRRAEAELIPALQRYGLGFILYFPLQNGLLTGKYRAGFAPEGAKITNLKHHLLDGAPWDALERFKAFARERGITPTAAALGWLLAQPTVTSVITGITVPEQLDENLLATQWVPSPDDERELRALLPDGLSGKPGVVVTREERP
ncbi:aldo/keto reductase [Protaetiibacter larvae]|uniref:Aldo/keto reductase n=1 Tax=Protaetiibacter larvae TaxID=2592654 RepID=A0A5C1YAB4_9MICO|nr:aldo/keto reductase [Protaetiibacter larvae]QEO10786.1 aldo/keto reductase [Protaetiibacter larvae]